MPVDTTHPEYDATYRKWEIMRDTIDGEIAIKAAGEKYLPRLYKQSAEDFASYVERSQFFNATDRTVVSLVGFIFRKNPEVVVDDSLEGFMRDVTMTGLSWYDFTKDTVREVLGMGRRGTLIDFDSDGEKRPYLCAYTAEQIINWGTERIMGRSVLTMLVLHEMDPRWIPTSPAEVQKGEPDEFEREAYDQWRVYRLVKDAENKPYVRCDVYRLKNETETKKREFVVVEQAFPTRRGVPLEAIPFVFHGPNNGLPCVDKIPLLDLALVNISLYRTSADLENGRHVAGTPTPWAAGFTTASDDGKAGEEFLLGTSKAWTSPEPTAKCGFMEFTGTGLGALEKAVTEKKAEMAALGARMLQPEAAKAEAFDTVAIRAAAEASALMSITIACTQTLSKVLQWVAWWNGTAATLAEVDEDIAGTELNTEFVIMSLPAEVMTALFAGYNAGALDFESLFWKLQQGEMIPPEATIDEVRANIERNPPAMIAQAQAAIDKKPDPVPPE